jgi:hypothetical protein
MFFILRSDLTPINQEPESSDCVGICYFYQFSVLMEYPWGRIHRATLSPIRHFDIRVLLHVSIIAPQGIIELLCYCL